VYNEDELKQLASAMAEPLRCGGMEYFAGRAFIRFGGKSYWYYEFKEAYEKNNNKFPEEWCKSNYLNI
jgi:hypothetical protein